MLVAFVAALLLVALAELGDKTQLLVLALASRYKTSQVVLGLVGAILGLQLIATVAGRTIGSLLPRMLVSIVAGCVFIGFGIFTLRNGADEDEEKTRTSRLGPVATVAGTFFLAELGDKTQIMTMTIAADPGAALRTLGSLGEHLTGDVSGAGAFVGVWLGSTVGMLIADGAALIIGRLLGKKLPERVMRRVAGIIFIVFGVLTLATAFLGGE